MIIGLFGALINNDNMGCLALTYSQIILLEEISKKLEIPFTYYVFEGLPDDKRCRLVEEELGLSSGAIQSFNVKPLFRLRRFIHHFLTGIGTIKALRKCDLCIDLTAGDSFTDIYGQYIFDSETNVKLLIERMGIPLILGPQTYGPYNTLKNIDKAIKTIEKANYVAARDQISADYLAMYTNKKIEVTTDLAFLLPYHRKERENEKIIRVGINISGLLITNKTEQTSVNSTFKTNYERYINNVIEWLLEKEKYQIYIIPHVGVDGMEWIKELYGEKLNYCGPYKSPIEAKNDISSMDIFIGSRMHATIGAFSSGVFTIPVAYSRKFIGLFEHLGYEYTIEMEKSTTDEALNHTIHYIEDYENMKDNKNFSEIINKEEEKNRRFYLEAIANCR